LVVEDQTDDRSVLRLFLELYGFQVKEAADGRQGVRRALSWQPDVAVVDIDLPHLNGYEVAQRIRVAFADRVHLVALTGYGKPSDKQRAYDAGFDLHITKPADPLELVRYILPK
jgi:CheY-like chemotaxis protein